MVKYALRSNLILSTRYGSTRATTHVPNVLDPTSPLILYRAKKVMVLCEFLQKLLVLLKTKGLRRNMDECERYLEKLFCSFSGVNGM